MSNLIEFMTLTTVHFFMPAIFPLCFTENGDGGDCCVFKRDGASVSESEREKGRDLFALQKPGRELS